MTLTLFPMALRNRSNYLHVKKVWRGLALSPYEYRQWTADLCIRMINLPSGLKDFRLQVHDHMGNLLLSQPCKGLDNVPRTLAANGFFLDTPATTATTLALVTVCPTCKVPMLLTPEPPPIKQSTPAPQMVILQTIFGGPGHLNKVFLKEATSYAIYNLRESYKGNIHAQDLFGIGLRAALLDPYRDLLTRAGSPDAMLTLPRPVNIHEYYGQWNEIFTAAGAPEPLPSQPWNVMQAYDRAQSLEAERNQEHTRNLEELANRPATLANTPDHQTPRP